MKPRQVGILIFEQAEVLDFAGPFEVFSVASELYEHELFNVFTVAKVLAPVQTGNGLSINPTYDFSNHPPIELLILSGGVGTRKAMEDPATLSWINSVHTSAHYTISICSGSRLLGKLGLLDGKNYCTHQGVYEHMAEIVPTGNPLPDKRFIQSGKIFTSGGISAGIDVSIHIVSILCGLAVARNTANYMEYSLDNRVLVD